MSRWKGSLTWCWQTLVVTITKKAPIARPIPRPISGGVLPLDRAANLSLPKLMIALTIIGPMSWLGKWDRSIYYFKAWQPSVPCVSNHLEASSHPKTDAKGIVQRPSQTWFFPTVDFPPFLLQSSSVLAVALSIFVSNRLNCPAGTLEETWFDFATVELGIPVISFLWSTSPGII